MAKAPVVDDSRAMRTLLNKTLKELGFEDREAANGKEALDVIGVRKTAATLILVDWNMPEMDGLDLPKEGRQTRKSSSFPGAMVTAVTELDRTSEAPKAGTNENVMKPFSRNILAGKIELTGIHPRGA